MSNMIVLQQVVNINNSKDNCRSTSGIQLILPEYMDFNPSCLNKGLKYTCATKLSGN